MISLQNKLHQIGVALSSAIPGKVSHYFRETKAFPYCIWAEDGEQNSFDADNRKEEQCIHGTVDYFTQAEYDSNVDTIQETLQSVMDGWELSSVQFEDTQRVIHFEWSWSIVVDGGAPNGEG